MCNLRICAGLGLRLAAVFRSIVDDSLYTRAGRAVCIGQPAERHEWIVLVQVGIVALDFERPPALSRPLDDLGSLSDRPGEEKTTRGLWRWLLSSAPPTTIVRSIHIKSQSRRAPEVQNGGR